MGKVILVGNQKGGVGKTTLTLTLAVGLKSRGYSVLVVDADPQRSISKWRENSQGLPHEESLPWVDQCASPLLAEKIKKEKPNYDFILIDTAGNIGHKGDDTQKIIAAAFRSADILFVPMGPSPLDVDGSGDFIEAAQGAWDVFGRDASTIRVVINGVRSNTLLGGQVSDYVAERYGLPILKTQIQSREGYRQCIMDGESIFHIGEKLAIDNANEFVDEVLSLLVEEGAQREAV